MDLENFENDFFAQNFNTNLNKIIQINKNILKNNKKYLLKIFQEYSSKRNHLRWHQWFLLTCLDPHTHFGVAHYRLVFLCTFYFF
jgi:hypothetical protein